MTINIQNIDVVLTSFSYVAVWVRPIAIFPSFISDKEFCNSFFGDKQNNVLGQTSDGFSIIEPGTKTYLIVSNDRITISSGTLEDVDKYFKKFVAKLKDDPDYLNFAKVKAYGTNFDFTLPLGKNAKDFISEKFSNENSHNQIENVEYRVPLQDDDYLYVKLMSSKLNKNDLSGSINHHHNISESPTSITEYELDYNESIERTKVLVLNSLN